MLTVQGLILKFRPASKVRGHTFVVNQHVKVRTILSLSVWRIVYISSHNIPSKHPAMLLHCLLFQ